MAPAARMAMTRRIQPLVSLNPYQGNWTIKVRVTSKGNMRTYKNARGEGCVFNVELTDEDVSNFSYYLVIWQVLEFMAFIVLLTKLYLFNSGYTNTSYNV